MSDNNSFNWEYEQTEREFENIPNGDYRLKILSAEKVMSKDKEHPKKMIKLKLGVSGFAKCVFHYIVFLPDNREITNRNLTNFFRSFGIRGGDFNLESYKGKIGAGRIETDSQGYERVRYFLEGQMKDRLPEYKVAEKKEQVKKSTNNAQSVEEDDIPF